jgi:hypothetical protein
MREHVSRRGFLAASGLTAVSGFAGVASAGNHGDKGNGHGNDDAPSDLQLFSEAGVDNSHEVDTDGKYAYVATGGGMSVVDWRNTGKPEVVASLDASHPAGDILDVKVDGGLASLASNGGPGITLVDVSDPENPEEITFFDAGHDVHNDSSPTTTPTSSSTSPTRTCSARRGPTSWTSATPRTRRRWASDDSRTTSPSSPPRASIRTTTSTCRTTCSTRRTGMRASSSPT